MNTISASAPAGCRSHCSASACTTAICCCAPNLATDSRNWRDNATSRSTSVACAAPRDTASSPSAPLPANRSSTRAPPNRGISQLNSVSRTRSLLGRSPGDSGTGSFVLRHLPPMIRTWPTAPAG
ncbi:hypothetical protein D3C71_1711030 [compost metagenome]